ncbi:hypothetical protein [Methylorubrum zatmanii]
MAQVISGNTGTTIISAGTTRFFTPGLVGTSASLVYAPAGRRGRFRNLRIVTPGAPGAGASWAFTLQNLTSDTALTCTVGAGVNQASDLINSVMFEANERWSLKVTASAGAADLQNALFSMLFEGVD